MTVAKFQKGDNMLPICLTLSGNGYVHRYYEDVRLSSQKLRGIVPQCTISNSYQGAVRFEFGEGVVKLIPECSGWTLSGVKLRSGTAYSIFQGVAGLLGCGMIQLALRVE
jgi:hypothetical protein